MHKFINDINNNNIGDKAKGLGRVVSKSLHAAKSVVKTQVLRQDRVTPEAFELRLAVCQNCPGGHATYNKDGSLHTCGPMLQSLKDAGQKTCGCVLKAKARDAKESCPFNHWSTPTPQQTELEALPLTVLNAKVENIELSEENQQKLDEMMSELRKRHGRLLGPDGTPYAIPATKNSEARTSGGGTSGGGLWTPGGDVSLVDPGRRRFLGAAAAMAGALIAPGYLWARNPEELCYFEVKSCEDGNSKWVRCDVVQGHKVGDTFKNGGTGGDGKCYEVKSNHQKQPQGEELDLGTLDWEDDCDSCDSVPNDCSSSNWHNKCWKISYSTRTNLYLSSGEVLTGDCSRTIYIPVRASVISTQAPDFDGTGCYKSGSNHEECGDFSSSGTLRLGFNETKGQWQVASGLFFVLPGVPGCVKASIKSSGSSPSGSYTDSSCSTHYGDSEVYSVSVTEC